MDTQGRTVGAHDGVINYTIGQRRGLPARGDAEPIFVVEIDPEDNRIVVGPHEMLMASGLLAEDLTFINGNLPGATVDVLAKIRYRSEAVPAVLMPGPDHTAEVRFGRPQRAVTPGQAVVFYEGDRVLGGGTISARLD